MFSGKISGYQNQRILVMMSIFQTMVKYGKIEKNSICRFDKTEKSKKIEIPPFVANTVFKRGRFVVDFGRIFEIPPFVANTPTPLLILMSQIQFDHFRR